MYQAPNNFYFNIIKGITAMFELFIKHKEVRLFMWATLLSGLAALFIWQAANILQAIAILINATK